MLARTSARLRPSVAFLALVIVVLGSLGSLAGARTWRERMEGEAIRDFEQMTAARTAAIEAELVRTEDALRSLRGFFGGSRRVDAPEFRRFVGSLDIARHYPALRSLNLLEPVEDSDVRALESRQRAAGLPGFAVSPPAEGQPVTERRIITLIEPLASNAAALGLDSGARAETRKAQDRARDTGDIAVSARFTLAQDAHEVAGFVMYLPVYRADARPRTVAARRAHLRGWVGASFTGDVFARAILGKGAGKVGVELFDGPADAAHTLAVVAGGARVAPHDRLERTTRIDVGGRAWTLSYRGGAQLEAARRHPGPLAALITGIVVSLLLAAQLWTQAQGRRRALELAALRSDELQATADRHRALLERLQEVVFEIDGEDRWLSLNEVWSDWTHWPVATTLGREVTAFVVVEDHPQLLELLAEVRTGGASSARRELRFVDAGGSPRWFEVLATGVDVPGDGDERRVAGTLRDITRRKRAEAELAGAQALIDAVFNNADAVIYAKDRGGRYLLGNRAWERLTGIASTRAAGRTDLEIFGAAGTALRENDLRVLEGGAPLAVEERVEEAGAARVYRSTKFPLTDGTGAVIGTAGVSVDVTAIKRAEEAAQAAEERFGRAFASSPVGLAFVGLDGRFEQANPALVRLLGRTEDELRTQTIGELCHPDDLAACGTVLPRLLAGEGAVQLEKRWVRPGGEVVTTRAHAVLLRDAANEPAGLFCQYEDVTLEARAQETLRRARDEALGASRLKTEFVANVSHELRTPLNGVLGMTELLLGTELDRRQREYVELAQRAGRSLLAVISDILDFSKIEAGKLELADVAFDVRDLLGDVSAVLGGPAANAGLELTTWAEPDVPRSLRGDDARLRQVLLNLAGNAVKFTPAGKVTVCAELAGDGETLRLRVRDTGVGIPVERQARLWDAFTQADASTSRTHEGTGLGLAITRELVTAMGGEIALESAPGLGTEFRVELPLRRGEAGAGERVAAAPLVPRSAPTGGEEGPRVLVVEDNAINQVVARETLAALGLWVDVAADGVEAVRLGAAGTYAAIFMDCHMPRLDGYAATAQIRAREDAHGRHTPIIAMTASAVDGDRERCLAAGMDDYLSKPLDTAELRRVLAAWVTDPAAADAEAEDRELRLEALDALAARMRPGALPRIVAMLTEEAPALVDTMARAAAEEDAEALWGAAHSLKSNLRVVGAEGLARLCEELELRGRAGETGEAPAFVARLATTLPVTIVALERRVAQRTADAVDHPS